MAEHLHLPCPTKEEEIAEGGIVATIDDDMLASLHEGGIETKDDGTARVIVHVVDHGGEVATVVAAVGVGEADGVVVVVIEEGALNARAGGIIGGALGMIHMANEIGRYRRFLITSNLAPAACHGSLNCLDNIAKAPRHALFNLNNTMPMISHNHLTQ